MDPESVTPDQPAGGQSASGIDDEDEQFNRYEARQEALEAMLKVTFPDLSDFERLKLVDDYVFINCDEEQEKQKCWDRIFKLMELDSYSHVTHIYGLAEELKPVIDRFLKRMGIGQVSDEARCMLVREILDYDPNE